MEQLPRLQARISNLKGLRDLFRALRALAASHVQEAQAALPGIRQYVEIVEDAIAEGAALLPEMGGQPPISAWPQRGVLIIVCSEHGFAGAFNERLLDQAQAQRKEGHDLAVIGRRGIVMAEERNLEIAWSFSMATHVGGVLGVTRRVAERLADVANVRVVFGGYRKGGNFEVETKSILPLDPALLTRARRGSRPIHHLAPEILLQRLASEYLLAQITGAIMESLASENAARLRVMENADHNIRDKLEDLQRKEHALRQETITSELLDAVTGAEAIFGSAGR